MKQVVFKSGSALCMEVLAPQVQPGMLLVDVVSSCISPGTEMTGLTGSGKTLWQKAKENPEKVKAAFERMKTEGVFSVLNKARSTQGTETLCGYSAAGVVREIGAGVTGFSVGMRVAVAGAGYANHAGQVIVPVNLSMPIPDGVSFQNASSCALGGIAMQGVRRAEVTLGDFVAVIGCGVLGLLTIQMLKAAGCRVVAVDLDDSRLALAGEFGAELVLNAANEDVVSKVTHFCNGHGSDKVIITAATSSNTPLSQAFGMSRRKGRVVLVGVIGSEFKRSDMYAKELDFVISTSYGPGRYDGSYEQKGIDYPYAYVRWTEKRNMEAYLHLIKKGDVDLSRIITASYSVDEAPAAYEAFRKPNGPLLVTLNYEVKSDAEPESMVHGAEPQQLATGNLPSGKPWTFPKDGILKVGLIGAGNFVQGMHLPNLKRLSDCYQVRVVCNQTGVSSHKVARMVSNEVLVETDYDRVLASDIDMVLIGTRHDNHAELAIRALKAGKAVFVEKPMCITWEEYDRLKKVVGETDAPFMVGYNRRFAPAVQKIQQVVKKRINPLMVHYTMNAGYIPYEAWLHGEEGGGRIVGEGCHLLDLFRSLTGSPAVSVSADGIQPKTASVRSSDNMVASIKYADGSVCTLLYTALGSKKAPKERMEVFCDEQMFVLDDYVKLTGFDVNAAWESKQADKGHLQELVSFYEKAREGQRFAIPWDEMGETWRISREIADQMTQ